MNKPNTRIWELDLLRGLAVLGMFYFHWFYLLDYWHLQSTDLFSGAWNIFGDTIRQTFLAVVGASMQLSYQKNKAQNKSFLHFGIKTMKRGLGLLAIGGLITMLSCFFSPDLPIFFGVLSFIGAALILLWPLMGRWYLLLGGTVFILLLEHFLTWKQASIGAYILGFSADYWPSADYFPLVPWLASVGAGALVARLIFKQGQRRYPTFAPPSYVKPVLWMGQKALWLYLAHIPVLAGLIWMWQLFAA